MKPSTVRRKIASSRRGKRSREQWDSRGCRAEGRQVPRKSAASLLLALLVVSCAGPATREATSPSFLPSAVLGTAQPQQSSYSTSGQTAVPAPAAPVTAAPTVALIIPSPAVVARTPAPPTAAPANLCGAPINPWNYTFCGGSFITAPPSNFCSYFSCIASFATGRGYVVQCADGMYGKSGGISGSCSGHSGNAKALYAP